MLSKLLFGLVGAGAVREGNTPLLSTNPRSVDLRAGQDSMDSAAALRREVSAKAAQLAAQAAQIGKLEQVLAYLGVAAPEFADPVHVTGHLPALEVYKTPDPRVRVEGQNTPPANSLEVSTLGTDDFTTPPHMLLASMVYSQGYVPTGVELQLPTFFLPNDERTLQVVHQGEEVFRCDVPTLRGPCKFDFTAAHAGQRFTVTATETKTGRVLQRERVYVPLPFMCAASTYSRTDLARMDCAPVPADSQPSNVLALRTPRGFAVEIEFMARDTSLDRGVFGPDALDEVHQCMDAKLAGTPLGSGVWRKWNWEEEPSMLPFGPRETPDAGEYGGRMAELTSPGPPHVLLGQQGLNDVVAVFDNLRHMGIQIGLWAQLHVHVNALSERAGGDCCLSTDQIANLWASWAHFQPVIDEMQSSTNVNNKWAMPLYLEDPIVKEVFVNMHAHYGTGLPAADACEAFYGVGMCDGKGESHGAYRPANLPATSVGFMHSPARYYALNLAPLTGKGTIEVRQQAGTHDPERAQRWIQFVLAFFETFKDEGAAFFDGSLAGDVRELQAAQEAASFDRLFTVLGDRVDAGSKRYFEEKHWAEGIPGSKVLKPGCSLAQD